MSPADAVALVSAVGGLVREGVAFVRDLRKHPNRDPDFRRIEAEARIARRLREIQAKARK